MDEPPLSENLKLASAKAKNSIFHQRELGLFTTYNPLIIYDGRNIFGSFSHFNTMPC